MKILVTGVGGQLGHDVMKELNKRGIEGIGSDLAPVYNGIVKDDAVSCMPYVSMDITDAASVHEIMAAVRPDALIHCAAWTAVDAAEELENRDRVFSVNVSGTENLANACWEIGCKMMYFSTDYVFDGQGTEPWKPDCGDFKPLNWYGESKLQGEKAVKEMLEKYFIIRTAWAFGLNGSNFVKTMLRLSKTHTGLRVVNDQIGTPTYTPDLARLVADMIITEKYGVYHATNEGGYISWYDFTCEILRQAGVTGVTVTPVTTAEYGLSKAARPFNSRLDKSKLVENGFLPLPEWKDALQRYLRELEDSNGTD